VLRNPNFRNKTVKAQIPAFEKMLAILRAEGVNIVDPVRGTIKLYKRITLDNSKSFLFVLELTRKKGMDSAPIQPHFNLHALNLNRVCDLPT